MSPSPVARRLLLALAVACLVLGVIGGLQRLGWALRVPGISPAFAHGTLMLCGVLGTVIALERAIALGGGTALAAPLASGLGAAFALAGLRAAAAALLVVAATALAAICVRILRRQPAAHNVALLAGALAWLAGGIALAAGAEADAVAAWWFTFVVLTVAAERLELGRLRPRHRLALPLFGAAGALLVAGAAAVALGPAGRILFGAGLVGIAAWLATFDVAWRTLHAPGYARYAACALLPGYAWLAVAGVAWSLPPHAGARDLALHGIALGFAFSMIFAHAPIILPVVTGVRVRFTPAFYIPLVALHASLVWRAGPGFGDLLARRTGAWLNVAALVAFALTMIFASRRPAHRTTVLCTAPTPRR